MDPIIIGIIGFAVLLILILARMPVGAAFMLVGFVGFGWLVGFKSALEMLQTVPFSMFASQASSVGPLSFLLVGLCLAGGLAYSLFAALDVWLHRCKTSAGLAAIVVCGLFGALSAFSRIGLKPLTKMLWPALQKSGYRRETAVGAITAGFSLGILLPLPNALLIIYGVITEQSIKLLAFCSVLPITISIVLYIVVLSIWGRKQSPAIVPLNVGSGDMLRALKIAWGPVLLFLFIILLRLAGITTPTESAGLAAVLALALVALRGRLNKATYVAACQTALTGTGWFCLLMLGTMIFGYFLTVTRLPYELSMVLGGCNRYVVLGLILLLFILLGCLLEALPLAFLFIPMLFPVVLQLGFHPVWFGVLVMRCIGLGLMLPYGGVNLRLVQKTTGVDARTAARGVTPFVIADLILVLTMIAVPQIILWPL